MALKEKKPGDHLILRLKNNESPLILDWINQQSNLSDAIRFLIEEEIKTHAIRDLQEYIPAKRRPLEATVEQAASEERPDTPQVARETQSEPEARTHSIPQVEEELPDQAKQEPEAVEEQKSAPDQEPEEITPEPEQTEPKVVEEKSQQPKPEPESEPEPAKDEENEYSEEIIDHWMNI